MHINLIMSKVKLVDENLVQKILEQGQKLRNAMIGSILKQDPLNTEIMYLNYLNTPQTSKVDLDLDKNDNWTTLDSLDQKRLEAFIKGECMTKEEEKLALDTLRSLSAPDLCRTAERSLQSTVANTCGCYTCEIYNSTYFNCDPTRNQCKEVVDPLSNLYNNQVTRDIKQKYTTNNLYFLKYVDSLRISINSLILNEKGNEKISGNNKGTFNFGQSFFVEYQMPDQLALKKSTRNISNNYVRYCSKRVSDIINFKQVTVHSLRTLYNINLSDYVINFKISYRNLKQKNSSLLGISSFNFASFLITNNLSCSRGLAVFLNNSPINVGTLKVSLQLGCGHLYFGQEFIDSINSSRQINSVVLDSDDSEITSVTKPNILKHKKLKESLSNQLSNKKKSEDDEYLQTTAKLKTDYFKETQSKVDYTTIHTKKQYLVKETQTQFISNIDSTEENILFGFLYISEAQYLNKLTNTYFSCKPFCQTEISISKVIPNNYNPVFNFTQFIPLVFDNDLLLKLRENYMVIEFWKKEDTTDSIIGLTKIPLHQFYLAYRNPIIIKYLCKNRLPIIGTDWYEPIYAINDEEILGQVQILIALGTEEQINNLKSDRGFTSNTVKAKCPQLERNCSKVSQNSIFLNNKEKLDRNPVESTSFCDQATNTSTSITSNGEEKNPITKVDIGMQSDLNMDGTINTQENVRPTQDMIGSLLNQIMSQRQQNIHVENSTNTEPICENIQYKDSLNHAQNKTNVELKRTTDLLDTLQKALSLDTPSKHSPISNKPDTFKASVAVNSANNLPSRRKCKVKKSRNRSLKHDDNILPSCYVTFETFSKSDLKVTPVVTRSTCPSWNFKSNVNLPLDLLTNTHKRLIFKVWKKSTNNVTVPNMQTDIVLGFAAIDLTLLLAGFPNVQGWYNIIDFSGKCNGQINIHVNPLENLNKYRIENDNASSNVQLTATNKVQKQMQEDATEPSELLSRTLKRKFIELDEITQRLRLRLSKVTNEDSDTSSDGITDEFEKDINTLCIEEDFDLINFEDQARKLSTIKENTKSGNSESSIQQLLTSSNEKANNSYDHMQVDDDIANGPNNVFMSSSATSSKTTLDNYSTSTKEKSLDQHFQEGKQKINTLLEKLTLLSAETNSPFTSRYVSGCSTSNEVNSSSNLDMEAILKELDHSSRPNIQSSLGFDPLKFQQLYGDFSLNEKCKPQSSNTLQSSNSDTSLITNFSDCRPAPDGEGNISDDIVSKIAK